MTYIIDKTTTKQDIAKIFELVNKKKKKKFDPNKYCGLIKTDKDALEIQKELRNEWE